VSVVDENALLGRLVLRLRSGRANAQEQMLAADELERLGFPEEFEQTLEQQWRQMWLALAREGKRLLTAKFDQEGKRNATQLAEEEVAKALNTTLAALRRRLSPDRAREY
jgi:hypothetical protein